MTTYPGAIDEFRTTQNIPGVLYDPDDTKTVFAEDTNNHSDAIIAIETELGTNPSGASATVVSRLNGIDSALAGKENSLGYTPENAANKSTTTSLGTSNTLYPTQNAVKSYVDTGLATKQNSLGFTAENSANKSTSTSLGTSNTLYPTQGAVKSYVDAAITAAKSALMPVGTIYGNATNSANPSTYLGFGTWVAYAPGGAVVGKAASGTFGTLGATTGAETVTLSAAQLPAHSHATLDATNSGLPGFDGNIVIGGSSGSGAALTQTASAYRVSGGGARTGNTGGGTPVSIIQPSKVAALWERTA